MDLVSLLQWNIKSLRHKKHELLHLINKFQPSVIAISETWLVPGSHFRVSGYSCIRDDRADGYAGSALLVRRSLPFSLLSLPPVSPNINVVAVNMLNISFLSFYISHPHSSLVSDILYVISSVPSPVIIMGDFNAHHSSWGSGHDDPFGLALLEIFDQADLCVMNNGCPTRRVLPHQNPRSVVDLSICSPSLRSLLSWSVLEHTYGSDHYPIVISMPNRVTPALNFCPSFKYRLNNVDWGAYASSLDNKLSSLSFPEINNISQFYSKFIHHIISSANEHFPLKKPNKFKISTPWWDAECSNAVKVRKVSEKRYKANMSIENYLSYKRNAAKATRLLKRKKRLGWVNFCEQMSPRTPSSMVWEQIKRFRGALNDNIVTDNNCLSWIEAFSNKMSPTFVPNIDSLPSPPSPLPNSSIFDSYFSFSELSLALEGLIDSSPGGDGIPYSFLKKASLQTKEFYLKLVNKFFEHGIIPQPWKNQIIMPIRKPGKPASDPTSYRPIALSSVLSKITEHMIKHRLEWLLENGNLLAKSQFGFRKGMSTIDNLSILTTDIRLSFFKKEYLVAVFLDISSAYDNVLLPVLKNKLMHHNIPEKLVRFICNLFMERSITIKHQNSFLPPRLVWRGLPQGSVLSPLLYSLYTSDLEAAVHSFCQILQYADDIVLYVSVKSLEEAKSRLNSALHYLSQWLIQHGLSISAPKSNVVIFTKKRIIPPVTININRDVIPQVHKVKFLGVWLDCRLSGVAHCDYVTQKCEKNLNILRCLSGVWWGAHPSTQKLLYNAIIRSHMDYGSFLLYPCNKLAFKKMDKIQSKCLRIILGAMRSSPINAMQVECGDPPLSKRRQYLCNRYLFKIIQNSNHPLFPKLIQLAELYDFHSHQSVDELPCIVYSYILFTRLPNPVFQTHLLPLYCTDYNVLVYHPKIILNFGIDKSTIEANQIFKTKLHLEYKDWFTLYTDASKSLGNVGVAVWIPFTGVILSYKCPSATSIFTAESIAILEAILFVKSHHLNNSIIFSDSKSCLQSILSNPFRSKSRFSISLRIREALFQCKGLGINIVLAWVPGHKGIPGNETADSCAKSAIDIGSLEHYQIYSHDICASLKSVLLQEWSKDWLISKNVKGKFYGDIQPDIPHKPWFMKFPKVDKAITSTICRLRLNHACTPVFLAKLRIRDNSICECGLGQGNVNHIFFSCSKLQYSLYDILPPEICRPTSFKFLLTLAFTPFIYTLCKFIKINKIKL